MSEFFYLREDDEEVKFEVDEDKSAGVIDLIFEYLRNGKIGESDDVTSNLDREEAALDLLENIVEFLEIEPMENEQ